MAVLSILGREDPLHEVQGDDVAERQRQDAGPVDQGPALDARQAGQVGIALGDRRCEEVPAERRDQEDRGEDEGEDGRVQLDDVRGRRGEEPAAHRVDQEDRRDDEQPPDVVDVEDRADDPGAAGQVAGDQDDEADGHDQHDRDFDLPVVTPEVEVTERHQVHPVEGLGEPLPGDEETEGQAQREDEAHPEPAGLDAGRRSQRGVGIERLGKEHRADDEERQLLAGDDEALAALLDEVGHGRAENGVERQEDGNANRHCIEFHVLASL